MNPFARERPRWFSIDAGRPFLDDLARGLLEALGAGGPAALADAVVLTPTRRAGRELAEAFLKASGAGALLLPQIRALGDLDEAEPPFEAGWASFDLPPAISAARRRYELARLAADHEAALGRRLDATGALALADALGAFLQGAQIEEAELAGRIGALAPEDMARHWQISAAFLERVLEAWPRRLAELGLMDADVRRVRLLRGLAAGWRARPPAFPIIAAGSTGSAPAAADLLAAIAGLPLGCVVLPGLDRELADSAWDAIEEDHPQAAMKRMLTRGGVGREAAAVWGRGGARERWRRRLINEALRPAEATADWLKQIDKMRDEGRRDGVDPIGEGLQGLSLIAARTEEEAAACAALLLREALETPGRTAALVSPDAALARRVSARLTRWGVAADSSAGRPLGACPVGALIALVARLAFDPLDPVTLLGVAKHPLVRLALEPERLGTGRFRLEWALRGPGPAAWDSINVKEDGLDVLAALRRAADRLAEPFANGLAQPADAARVLTGVLEELAAGPAGGTGGLWAGPAGEAAAVLLAGLIDEGGALPGTVAAGFVGLVDGLLAGETVRGDGAAHPRLKVLGVLEARLMQADLLILAGLEEGVWPQAAPVDPFLSRPMRQALGLPPPERRLGLAAHDFAQGACAPEVVLISTGRRDGAPTVASRWLWRLQTLVRGAGLDISGRPDILAAARAIDAPGPFRPAPRPCPKPPLEVRPRALPVTGVERWVRDPYAVYARYVLGLELLERPGEPMEALARGTAVHRALERFAREHPGPLGPDADRTFVRILIECLADAGMPQKERAREHALARNVAPFVIGFELERRPGARVLVEQKGRLEFPTLGGAFTLTARADRIEVRETQADILDFKTGSPPTKRQVESGLAPQLTLTAAILAAGGFADAGPIAPGELAYVKVSGRRIPGKVEKRAEPPESQAMAALALDGLKRRVDAFDRPETGYLAWAAPQFMEEYGGEYDHLERVWEWAVIGGEDEDEVEVVE